METVSLIALIVAGTLLFVVAGLVVYLAFPLKHPFVTESDYSHHTFPWWHICYGHKYLRPAKNPVKGSGLEAHFAGQDFEYSSQTLLVDAEPITVCAVGDLMTRKDLVGGDDHLWDEVGDDLFGADITLGNLEYTINPKWIIAKTVRYSAGYDQAKILLGSKTHGPFDVLALANNHMNDTFSEGIETTCDFLDEQGICHVGASRTPDEQKEVAILERVGAKIAVLSYTFSTNNLPLDEGFEHGLNLVRFNAIKDSDYDPSLILDHIAEAKRRGADYIIASNHWANDMEFYPPPQIVRRAHEMLEAGVDMIIGHHSHVPGKLERYRTEDGRDCLVCYSLGNFTTVSLPFAVQKLGQMIRIELETGLGPDGARVVRPRAVTLIPHFHSMNARAGGGVEHRILRVIPGIEAIDNDNPPPYFSGKDTSSMRKIARIYRKNFTFKGVTYK